MRSFVDWLEDLDCGFYVRKNWSPARGWHSGGRLVLQPIQRRVFDHALSPDEEGNLPYEVFVYSAPKKSGKTTLEAATAAWYGEEGDAWSEVYFIANSKEHARSLGFAMLSEHLAQRGMVQYKNEATYDNGSSISVLATKYSTAAGGDPAVSLWDELWAYELCDDQTEAYTIDGWKSYQELKPGDIVATWKGGHWEWQPLTEVKVYEMDEPLLELRHRRCSMMIHPDHRVLGKFKSGGRSKFDELEWEIKVAQEASQAYEGLVPTTAEWSGKHEDLLHGVPAQAWMGFLGYYIAEGNLRGRQTQIAQSQKVHPEECARIEDILNRLGVEWHYRGHQYKTVGQAARWIGDILRPLGHAHEKYVPELYKNLSRELLQTFLMAYLEGDGWKTGSRGYQCSTTSKRLADDLLEIGIKCGWTVRYMGTRPALNENSHDIYRMSFSKGNVCYHRKNWSEKHYKGIGWCLKVPNESFLARREGTVYWTGNTESHRRMWTEMTIPPTQRNPLKGIFTYAGYKATAVLLWELYESIVLEGEPVPELIDIVDDKGRPVCWQKGKMFAYWDTVPRMPWQTKEYYEKQAKTPGMRPQEFLRLHRNKWATTEDPFVPIDWWDDAVARGEKVGLVGPVIYTPDSPLARYPLTISVDAAAKYASTSLTAIYWDIQRGRVGLAYHKTWEPDPTEMFDFDKTVGAHIEWLKKKGLIIRQIVYDPRFLHQTMVRLKQKGYRVIEYAQSNKSLALASQALYDALQQGTFEAYPAPDLRKHLEYAQAKNTPQGFRIYKEKHAKYDDDGAISLAMGTYMAIESGGFDRGRAIRIEMPFGNRSKMKHIPKHRRKELEFLPEELRS